MRRNLGPVENLRFGGWWLAPIRLLLILVIWAPLPLALGFATQISRLATSLPDVPNLDEMRPAFGSRVETVDGWYLGGSRVTQAVAFEDLPAHVIGAVMAAEDENFFSHQAFSFRAIARAALENYRFGRTVQGASTITQQVARYFLDTREKSYDRKIKELLLARRIEANYPKNRILAAYIGGVFWGHTAHGITQASWQYFGKSPTELDLGEAALLAGLLPAPSRYSPFKSVELATRERARVLRRMVSTGMISQAEADASDASQLVLNTDRDEVGNRMPAAYQAGLRFITTRGDDLWASGGITAVVPHAPLNQAIATRAVRQAVIAIDHRQGWRGSPGRATGAVDEQLIAQDAGRFALARVTRVSRDAVDVVTRGGTKTLRLAESDWAEPAATPRHYKRPVRLSSFVEILHVDDLVYVDFASPIGGRGGAKADKLLDSAAWPRPEGEPALAQVPIFEAATIAIDSQTGRLLAAVGGFDSDSDSFDRVFQGCRQPGSVFKPIVYAEALSKGLTAATMLSDVPTEVATGRGDVWRPRNADRDFKGYVTLANALAWSRNIPTVNLMDHLGPRFVVGRAKKLGVTESRLATTSSVSLGASCLRPYEVAQIYAAFQRHGRTVGVGAVASWVDHLGAARDDTLHFATAGWRTAARLSRMARVEALPDRGVSENVAFIMTDLLRRVVTSGTAHDLPNDWLIAGKTGTTNEFDAWFVGFDETQTVAAWVGADKNRVPLGRGEHGATTAMPVFASYYDPFARMKGDDDAFPGEPPPGIEYVAIDATTGLLTPPGEWGVKYPFVVGTAPTDLSPTRGTKQAQRLDELSYEF